MPDLLLDAVTEFVEAVEAATQRAPEKKARSLWAALRADQAEQAHLDWALRAEAQLAKDRAVIVTLAQQHLVPGKADDDPPPAPRRRRFIAAVEAYLKGPSQAQWKAASEPLLKRGADRAGAVLAGDLGFSFELLRSGLAKYVEKEAAFLVTSISDTTRDRIQQALADGLEQGLGARAIAKSLEDLPAFDRTRALLVARTESARVTNGAPTEALKATQAETGRKFLKTWNSSLDDRVRPEHAAMEQETVGLEENFSNGLGFPQEPNCRCVLTYQEAPA